MPSKPITLQAIAPSTWFTTDSRCVRKLTDGALLRAARDAVNLLRAVHRWVAAERARVLPADLTAGTVRRRDVGRHATREPRVRNIDWKGHRISLHRLARREVADEAER